MRKQLNQHTVDKEPKTPKQVTLDYFIGFSTQVTLSSFNSLKQVTRARKCERLIIKMLSKELIEPKRLWSELIRYKDVRRIVLVTLISKGKIKTTLGGSHQGVIVLYCLNKQ